MAVSQAAEESSVSFCECWPRDGIQGWPEFIATSNKVSVIDAVVGAGVTEVDATSFVPAKTVPQFADAEKLLSKIDESVRVRVVTVNVKGVERALDAHRSIREIDTVGFPISASQPHNIANLRRDHASHLEALDEMIALCDRANVPTLLSVSTAFGCPIAGRVEPESVLNFVEWGVDHGVERIMIGDTTGMADPRSAYELFTEATRLYPSVSFIAHFHDNRGRGIANSLAAIDAGAQTVDGSLGGLGGEPKIVEQGQAGELGNVSSEDLIATLDQMGIGTGVDVDALVDAGRLAERILGVELRSAVLRAGPVPANVGFVPRGKE